MNIWEPDKLILFLGLFIPGFVSIKVYELIIATKKRNFKDSLLEAVGFSVLNFAALSWLFLLLGSPGFSKNHPILFSLLVIAIFFIFPALWPIIFVRVSKWKRLSKYIISPISMPWDFVFSKRKSAWIIVHLKDGRRVGGKYSTHSRASAYPNQRQLYLEELWLLNKNGSFNKPVERSSGAIIIEDEISIIEFFK
jgi:hypothetical protein